MSKTIMTASAVIIGAASAGTALRHVENSDFDTAFMLSTIGLVIAGVVTVIRIAEWHFARTAPKGHNH